MLLDAWLAVKNVGTDTTITNKSHPEISITQHQTGDYVIAFPGGGVQAVVATLNSATGQITAMPGPGVGLRAQEVWVRTTDTKGKSTGGY